MIQIINKIGGIELTISKEEKDYINEFVHESYNGNYTARVIIWFIQI